MIVAVYGSLRDGMGNHGLMKGSDFMGKGLLQEGSTMFSNGGFPILSFAVAKSEPILAELYDVANQRDMAMLDRLEGYPTWYNRTQKEFLMEDGRTMTAWIYHQDQDFTERLPVVESGDWVKYRMSA